MNDRQTTTESPGPEPSLPMARRRAGAHRPGLVHLVSAAVCLLVAIWLLSWRRIQWLEASSASWFLRHLGAGGEAAGSMLLVVDGTRHDVEGLPPGGWVSGGFNIAPSCSVSMFLAVLFALAAVLFATGRIPVRRAVRLLAAVSGLFLVVSQVRLVVSGLLVHTLGQADGFPIAHVLVGTVISTLGLVVGLAGFAVFALRSSARPSGVDASASVPLRPNQSPEPVTTGEP